MQCLAAIRHNRSTITTAVSKNENSAILQSLKEKLNQTENIPIPGKIILLKKNCVQDSDEVPSEFIWRAKHYKEKRYRPYFVMFLYNDKGLVDRIAWKNLPKDWDKCQISKK